jgi:ABC-type xylose transport system permease subunit
MAQANQSAAPTPVDERVAQVGFLARLFKRPDAGAFVGALFVFFLFAYTARQVNWAGDFGVWSSWLNTAAYDGIVAVPVALLMIGGEFDLSAGVMIGSSGLLLGILTTRAHWNIWPAIVVVLCFGLAIGLLNGGSRSSRSGPGCSRAPASATGSSASAATPWRRATSACPSSGRRCCSSWRRRPSRRSGGS